MPKAVSFSRSGDAYTKEEKLALETFSVGVDAEDYDGFDLIDDVARRGPEQKSKRARLEQQYGKSRSSPPKPAVSAGLAWSAARERVRGRFLAEEGKKWAQVVGEARAEAIATWERSKAAFAAWERDRDAAVSTQLARLAHERAYGRARLRLTRTEFLVGMKDRDEIVPLRSAPLTTCCAALEGLEDEEEQGGSIWSMFKAGKKAAGNPGGQLCAVLSYAKSRKP